MRHGICFSFVLHTQQIDLRSEEPPDPSKAEAAYRYEDLKGWCPYHDWQTLSLDEQDEMIRALRRESKSALA